MDCDRRATPRHVPLGLARFGSWADKAFAKARVNDQYANRFSIHFPNEERSAGSPARTRPVYEKQKNELNAVFGLNVGWEHPLWYANKLGTVDSNVFTRQNWWEVVGRECRNLRKNAGFIDISNFARYRVRGSGAAQWLDNVFANHMPTIVGRSCLTPLFSYRGGIAGDFTVTLLAEEDFFIVGSEISSALFQCSTQSFHGLI